MPNINIPELVLRNTSDGAWHAQGLVVGSGLTLENAIASLGAEARAQAEEAARPLQEARSEPDAIWPFEVVDIRLVVGPPDSGTESWAAIGTLRSRGINPWEYERRG
jgi:hypothetical protein